MEVTELLLSRDLSKIGKIGQRKILSIDQRSASYSSAPSRLPSRGKADPNLDRKAVTSLEWRTSRNFGKSGARRAVVIDQTSQQKEMLRRVRDMQMLIKTLQYEIMDKDERIDELSLMASERKVAGGRRKGHESPDRSLKTVDEGSDAENVADTDALVRFHADDDSRIAIDRLTESLIRMYMRDGSLQKKVLREEIAKYSDKTVLRWGTKENRVKCTICPKTESRLADLEARFLETQSGSLKEISILRRKLRVAEIQVGFLKDKSGGSVNDALLQAESKSKELDMKLGGDNEMYEPLMGFPEDQRELMIGVINEKVRHILTMDLQACGNKLPFGMKLLPEEEASMKLGKLEDENKNLATLLEKFKTDYFSTLDERDSLRTELNRLNTMGETDKQREVYSETALKTDHDEQLENLRLQHLEELDVLVKHHEDQLSMIRNELERARLNQTQIGIVVDNSPVCEDGHEAEERIASLERLVESLRTELAEAKLVEEREISVEENTRRISVIKGESEVEIEPEPEGDSGEVDALKKRVAKIFEQNRTLFQGALGIADAVRTVSSALGINLSEGIIFGTLSNKLDEDEVMDQLSQILAQEVTQLHEVRNHIAEMSKVREFDDAEMKGILEEKRSVISNQQGELERLQLLVDEMRRRIVDMSKSAEHMGIPQEKIDAILESSGLMEVADAIDKATARKVFQRLYDDAMDRLRRYSVMQAKLMAAYVGQALPEIDKEMELKRKYRVVDEYCDSKIQEWSAASHYKTLPPDYLMYGWIPEHVETKPFSRYMKMLEETKSNWKSPTENDGRRPLPMENRLLWRPRQPQRVCSMHPVDRRMNRTWTALDMHHTIASDDGNCGTSKVWKTNCPRRIAMTLTRNQV